MEPLSVEPLRPRATLSVSGAEIRYRTAGYYVFSPASDPILSDGRLNARVGQSVELVPARRTSTVSAHTAHTHPPHARSERQRTRGDRDAGRWRHTATCEHPSRSRARARHRPPHDTCHAEYSAARARHGGTRPWRVFLVHSSPMCPPAAPAALARNMMRTQVHACHTAARDHARHQRHPFVWKMINSHRRRCARARVPRLRRGPRKEHVRAVPSVAPYEEVLLMHTASPPRRRLRQSIV